MLWEEHPEQLQAHAFNERMTSQQYVANFRGNMWGGSPEMTLLAENYAIGFKVLNMENNVLFQVEGKTVITLLNHANHHYLFNTQARTANFHAA